MELHLKRSKGFLTLNAFYTAIDGVNRVSYLLDFSLNERL